MAFALCLIQFDQMIRRLGDEDYDVREAALQSLSEAGAQDGDRVP